VVTVGPSVGTTCVPIGGTITVDWTNNGTVHNTDWIGLIPISTCDAAIGDECIRPAGYNKVYVSSFGSSGTETMTSISTAHPDTDHRLYYFYNDQYYVVAGSTAIVVSSTACPGSPVAPSATITLWVSLWFMAPRFIHKV
jgi:hypothetical protein